MEPGERPTAGGPFAWPDPGLLALFGWTVVPAMFGLSVRHDEPQRTAGQDTR